METMDWRTCFSLAFFVALIASSSVELRELSSRKGVKVLIQRVLLRIFIFPVAVFFFTALYSNLLSRFQTDVFEHLFLALALGAGTVWVIGKLAMKFFRTSTPPMIAVVVFSIPTLVELAFKLQR